MHLYTHNTHTTVHFWEVCHKIERVIGNYLLEVAVKWTPTWYVTNLMASLLNAVSAAKDV